MPHGFYRRKGPTIVSRRPWVSHDIASVSGSKIDDGTITQAKLEPALLQGFHVELASDAYKIAPGVAIPFITGAISEFGAEQWASSTLLSLGVGCMMRIHARIHLRADASALLPGARALLRMVAGATVIATGPWSDATITSDGIVEIVADLYREMVLNAGSVQTYSFSYLGQQADGSAVTTWIAMQPKAGATNPPHTGTFCEGMVVPRKS